MADDEEAATETESLESAAETFDGDFAEILTRREEAIKRRIRERVQSGDLDERAGRFLSAYVSGAYARLMFRHMDRSLSFDEKRAIAEELTGSTEWDQLDSQATLARVSELLLEWAASDLHLRQETLFRVRRPPPPVITDSLLRVLDSIRATKDGRTREDSRSVLGLRYRPTTDARLTSQGGLFDMFQPELR